MNWKYCIPVGLIFFGIGFLIGWHPAFESVRNYVVGALSLAVVIELGGILRELYKDRKEKKAERCKELEGYLQHHSNDLVKDVLRKWFGLISDLHTILQDSPIVGETPLNKTLRDLHTIDLLYSEIALAVSHLKAEVYIIEGTQFIDLWIEYDTLINKKKSSEGEELDLIQLAINERVTKLRKRLNKIIADFEMEHYILKGTCERCKRKVDELKKLDKSYYEKLICPD